MKMMKRKLFKRFKKPTKMKKMQQCLRLLTNIMERLNYHIVFSTVISN